MILLTCATGLCLAALGTSQTQEPAKKRVHGPGLHHIAIKVADFDKSVTLYRDGLGMKQVYKWG
jgi:catechol-2,3-dioxygenase